jgi:hypothetical protein
MGVPWHKLGERVHDGNNRLTELLVLHARGDPQGTGACHSTAFGADSTSQRMLIIHIDICLFSGNIVQKYTKSSK